LVSAANFHSPNGVSFPGAADHLESLPGENVQNSQS